MTTEELTQIAKRLKECRELRELSYQDLSDKTGLAKSTLQRYEKGFIKKIPVETVKLIASVLNVDAGYLMGWNDNKPTGYYFDDETAVLAQEIYDNPDLRILMDASRKLKPEELKAFVAMIKTVKGIE